MYKIVRGLGILEQKEPFLIVTATNWRDKNIDLERFILLVEHKKEDSEAILLSVKTRISTVSGILPENPKFELDVLLEEELLCAKQHYYNWMHKQIGDKAFAQNRNVFWQENNGIIPFALMYYKLNQKSHEKVTQIARNTFCKDLRGFLETVANLRLTVEKEDN